MVKPAQNITIASDARARAEDMRALVEALRQPDLPEVDTLFAKALEQLSRCQVRISVVGQVKAGKSSLINVLSGKPDLLPTEVNPWTAVITSLHFGHPDKPHSGGVFQLFSEEEWQRMIEGDKETREMAENLLPGFDSETLKRQVSEMQESAKQRLGGLYRHLLGKKHSFNTITPEILERYVSAGHQTEQDGEPANAGRFSGITKSAEVYLGAEPFALPVTLSDTPGINDPFLVRDEITTSSFRETDIFVVALSIHQALSAADMALLKMLARHSGKAITVFVNRIDEVDDPALEVPPVLEALRERLESELGEGRATVVAGSAYWGAVALFGSDAEVAEMVQAPACAGYGKATGLDGGADADDRQRLFAASGVPALAAALSEAIDTGPVQAGLGKIASEVAAAVRMQENILCERLKNEEVVLMDVGDIPAILEAEKNRLITRINQLADLADDLDRDEDSVRTDLLHNAETVSASITNTIDATLGRFIDEQTAQLKARLEEGGECAKWSLDTAELRRRIEEQVVLSYHEGRTEMDVLFAKFAAATGQRMAAVLGPIKTDGILDNLPHDEIMPGFKPSTTLVDVELVKDKGWKFWKKNEMTVDEAMAQLQRVIRQEMLPAITDSCNAARTAIAERSREAQTRIAGIKQAARSMIVDEVTTMKAEIETLDQGVNAEAIAKFNANREKRAAEMRARLAELARVKETLAAQFPETATGADAVSVTPASGGE